MGGLSPIAGVQATVTLGGLLCMLSALLVPRVDKATGASVPVERTGPQAF